MLVAIDKHHVFKPFHRPPNCKIPSYSQMDCNMVESTYTSLKNTLKDAFDFASIHKSLSSPCMFISTIVEEEFDSSSRIELIAGNGAPRVRALVVEVSIAMASGNT
ncbi:hypothetical protein ACH5RR_000960 [Cinchona calisaya]|uniref:Uncharacterized protein n=1 Tax=Cinchona calisaya TaxID=153742 RepID=A0ABD3B2A0_9GENT